MSSWQLVHNFYVEENVIIVVDISDKVIRIELKRLKLLSNYHLSLFVTNINKLILILYSRLSSHRKS
jgi:hypothetical protein